MPGSSASAALVAETRRRARRRPPARSDGDCARASSSRGRSRRRARRRAGGRERAHVGEARDEALVVGQHGRDLRLLQHDLREPDAVRVARVLPGQRVAPVLRCQATIARRRRGLRRVAALAHRAMVPRARQAWRCSISSTGTASSNSGRSSLTSAASVASGAAKACSRKRLGKLADSRLELLQPLVLGLDLVDARLQLAGGGLDLLERLAAPLERLAALAQLGVDLRRDRLVPELELAARVLEHDPQLGDQHAPELLHELRLRQAQRQGQAEVLDVVALDQLQLAREAVEVERLADDAG